MQGESAELSALRSRVSRLSALVGQYRSLVAEAEAAKQTIERLKSENKMLLERITTKDEEISALRQKTEELQRDNQDLHSLARDALEQNEQLMVKLRLADSRFDRAMGSVGADLTESELSTAVPGERGSPRKDEGATSHRVNQGIDEAPGLPEDDGESGQGLSCTAPEVSLSLTDGQAGASGVSGVSNASVEHVPLTTAEF